jgi:putative flippase GtrA
MDGGTFRRFLIVGCSNTLVSFLVFHAAMALLPETGWRGGLSQALAYAAGMFWSFTWSRRWTFRSSGRVHHEMARFALLNAGALAVSTLALHGLVDRLAFNATLSWLAVTVVITTLNFLLMRHWVFRVR